MIKLSSFTPTNVLEEKAKFLADNSYNPQFIYPEPIPTEALTKYGSPDPQHLAIAQRILSSTIQTISPSQLRKSQGRVLSESEVKQTIANFLKLHQLEHRFSVSYSASYVARTAAAADQLKIRLPMEYRQKSLQGMLYHEVGTHVLRRINYEQQPWYRKKNAYGFSEYLPTEEGLATLHSRIPHTHKVAFTQALHYLAISTALQQSFVEVWQAVLPYSDSLEQCWAFSLRAKRGMIDTSQPGGNTKDITYLDGMIAVWKWLKEREFDVTPLYFGKLALADVDKAVALNPDFSPQLPLFFTKDRKKYQKEMLEIGTANGFDL